MTHLTPKLVRTLLACALTAAAGLAQAGVSYHVDVDSTGHTGPGSLELTFLGLANAAPASATASGFTGLFGTDGDQQGSVTGSFPGQLVFNNGGANDFWRSVTLGGVFGFDVDFDLPIAAGANTTFAVMLADAAGYLTVAPVAAFELAPGSAVAVSADPTYARVAAVTLEPARSVPEPASWKLAGSGLLLMGVLRRLRR